MNISPSLLPSTAGTRLVGGYAGALIAQENDKTSPSPSRKGHRPVKSVPNHSKPKTPRSHPRLSKPSKTLEAIQDHHQGCPRPLEPSKTQSKPCHPLAKSPGISFFVPMPCKYSRKTHTPKKKMRPGNCFSPSVPFGFPLAACFLPGGKTHATHRHGRHATQHSTNQR